MPLHVQCVHMYACVCVHVYHYVPLCIIMHGYVYTLRVSLCTCAYMVCVYVCVLMHLWCAYICITKADTGGGLEGPDTPPPHETHY